MSAKEVFDLTEEIRAKTEQALDSIRDGLPGGARALFEEIGALRRLRDRLKLSQLEVDAARQLLAVDGGVARVFDQSLLRELYPDIKPAEIVRITESDQWQALAAITDEDRAKVRALVEGLRVVA